MFKNKNNNSNNLCGKKIKELRQNIIPRMSQRALADKLQLMGMDLDKNAIQRIESGQRFVTDIELAVFSQVFCIAPSELLGINCFTEKTCSPINAKITNVDSESDE